MKFIDKLELAQKLKNTVHIVPFSMQVPSVTQPHSTTHVCNESDSLQKQKEHINSMIDDVDFRKDTLSFQDLTQEIERLKEEKTTEKESQEKLMDDFRKKQEAYTEMAKYLKQAAGKGPVRIPGIVESYCPPAPSDTKILLDGNLVDNVYSVDYAYLYNVDDRTPEEVVHSVPADPYHVVGWITLMFFSPLDAATFNVDSIRMINTNDYGQTFDISIVGIHTVAETGGVTMNDVLMTKTVFFEAKDIIGRANG